MIFLLSLLKLFGPVQENENTPLPSPPTNAGLIDPSLAPKQLISIAAIGSFVNVIG